MAGSTGGLVMRMGRGETCMGGVARTVAVGFVCGVGGPSAGAAGRGGAHGGEDDDDAALAALAEAEPATIVDVNEDGICTYAMVVATPAACSMRRAERLQQEAGLLRAALVLRLGQ